MDHNIVLYLNVHSLCIQQLALDQSISSTYLTKSELFMKLMGWPTWPWQSSILWGVSFNFLFPSLGVRSSGLGPPNLFWLVLLILFHACLLFSVRTLSPLDPLHTSVEYLSPLIHRSLPTENLEAAWGLVLALQLPYIALQHWQNSFSIFCAQSWIRVCHNIELRCKVQAWWPTRLHQELGKETQYGGKRSKTLLK